LYVERNPPRIILYGAESSVVPAFDNNKSYTTDALASEMGMAELCQQYICL
jgi:hypothetical protein